jgi:hypothetical protein
MLGDFLGCDLRPMQSICDRMKCLCLTSRIVIFTVTPMCCWVHHSWRLYWVTLIANRYCCINGPMASVPLCHCVVLICRGMCYLAISAIIYYCINKPMASVPLCRCVVLTCRGMCYIAISADVHYCIDKLVASVPSCHCVVCDMPRDLLFSSQWHCTLLNRQANSQWAIVPLWSPYVPMCYLAIVLPYFVVPTIELWSL